MSYENRSTEVATLLESKHWNIHMLRKCIKVLTKIDKKNFKAKRAIATLSNNSTLERKILQEMLIDSSKKLTEKEWENFYNSLLKFVERSTSAPTKKVLSLLELDKFYYYDNDNDKN